MRLEGKEKGVSEVRDGVEGEQRGEGSRSYGESTPLGAVRGALSR